MERWILSLPTSSVTVTVRRDRDSAVGSDGTLDYFRHSCGGNSPAFQLVRRDRNSNSKSKNHSRGDSNPRFQHHRDTLKLL
jgi:hypothetical protein